MNYLTSCPSCGSRLQPHVGPPQNAPWLCSNCRRGWWCSELSTDARRAFRPRFKDFGRQPVAGLVQEIAEAHKRGHSVHPSMEHLPGVTDRLAALRRSR